MQESATMKFREEEPPCLVGAGEAGRGLHAPVGLDPVEGVLVAPAPTTQHRLGPPGTGKLF